MKIVVDNRIPFIKGVFESCAEVIYAEGQCIDAAMVFDADAIITRTRTKCNAALLTDSKVRYIATATIGYDHIDMPFCKANAIEWTNAPGCNADAVVQYVFSALYHLSLKDNFDLSNKVLGVVGVGNVGRRVAAFAERLGMRVLRNDPPRADKEGADGFVSLADIQEQADIISFHTPLTKDCKYSTFHLFNDNFVNAVKRCPVIINACRGGVCSSQALIEAKQTNQISNMVIDCWEGEPDIDTELLSLVDIATFHIAGYSLEGKANATTAAVQAISRFFQLGLNEWEVKLPAKTFAFPQDISLLEEVSLSYPIMNDDHLLRTQTHKFEDLRGHYDFRREPDVL